MLSGRALFAAETDGTLASQTLNAPPRSSPSANDRFETTGVDCRGGRRSPLFRKLLVASIARRSSPTSVTATSNLFGLTFVGGGQLAVSPNRDKCRQSTANQIAALGHELQHAVEIAEAAAAVDQTSIRALYGTIGFATDDSERRFESDAAQDAGNRVRRELSGHLTTTSYAVK